MLAEKGIAMERFVASLEASLATGNWLSALFLALALPDICASLEDPGRPVGDRYKDWFQRNLRVVYDPANMLELVEATAPQAVQGLPQEARDALRAQPAPAHSAFTAEDCYRLRCKCLHQGLPERMGAERVHFTAPDALGRINLNRNVFNGVLQISVEQFCRDVGGAVGRWWEAAQADPVVVARAASLLKVYALDDTELPIVHYAGQ